MWAWLGDGEQLRGKPDNQEGQLPPSAPCRWKTCHVTSICYRIKINSSFHGWWVLLNKSCLSGWSSFCLLCSQCWYEVLDSCSTSGTHLVSGVCGGGSSWCSAYSTCELRQRQQLSLLTRSVQPLSSSLTVWTSYCSLISVGDSDKLNRSGPSFNLRAIRMSGVLEADVELWLVSVRSHPNTVYSKRSIKAYFHSAINALWTSIYAEWASLSSGAGA